MATTHTYTSLGNGVHLFTWNLTDGETGEAATIPGATDVTFQSSGTFTGVTNQVLQGSCEEDQANFIALNDVADVAIDFTSAAGIAAVQENCVHYRPVVTGGTSSAIQFSLLCKRTR